MRRVAVGDPQTTFEHLRAVLAAKGLLTEGRLAEDVQLVVVGDYFDFGGPPPEEAAAEGVALLEWLASHPPERAVLLMGNHDVSRVQELAGFDDAGFAEARRLAGALDEASFVARYPALPDRGVAQRDFSCFSVAQRRLVQRLLLEGRLRLATVAQMDGQPLLITHAAYVGEAEAPLAAAKALNEALDAAVEAVRADWEAGGSAPLDLRPWHSAGTRGREGYGLLYQRPAAELSTERRFDPRQLPPFAQAGGHTQHHKSLKMLAPFASDRARSLVPGALRSLRVEAGAVVYDAAEPPRPEVPTLYCIDGSMHRVAPEDYALLELDGGFECVC